MPLTMASPNFFFFFFFVCDKLCFLDEDLLLLLLHTQTLTHRVSVRSPRPKLHVARLFVEWKVLDVNFAKGFVNGGRFPRDGTVVAQDRFCHDGYFVVAIGAVIKWKKEKEKKNLKTNGPLGKYRLGTP